MRIINRFGVLRESLVSASTQRNLEVINQPLISFGRSTRVGYVIDKASCIVVPEDLVNGLGEPSNKRGNFLDRGILFGFLINERVKPRSSTPSYRYFWYGRGGVAGVKQ